MPKSLRKWLGLIAAITLYYLIHEGGHLVTALIMGTFQRVRFAFWGLGIQIVVDSAAMSDPQLFLFSIIGSICSLIAGYILVINRKRLLQMRGKLPRAIAYYSTLVFLCLDPLYLSVLYRFVGGGDMNGILLSGIPESGVGILFFMLLALNLLIVIKVVLPAYRQRFSEDTYKAAA